MAYFKTVAFVTIASLGALLTFHGTQASAGIHKNVTREMASAKTAAFEKAMNNTTDPLVLIKFMHEHISDDAKIAVTVSNATNGINDGKSPVMELNKTDYINSYVQARPMIEQYEASVDIVDFRYDATKNKAVTVEVISERGISERAFNSRTKCITEHKLQNDILTSTKAVCHTDISFEENI